MLAALLLTLVSSFPSAVRTAWMTPQSFRLTIGMPQTEARKALEAAGWTVKPGKRDGEAVVDYADDKALTLEFSAGRLRSVRFEFFGLIPDMRAAFAEQKALLRKEHGTPKKSAPAAIVYDDRLPNIMVVLSADPKSEYGRKGVAYLAVRYYDPLH